MALTDFIDALPEDKREAFKAEAAKYVSITSDSDAEKFAESNEFLRKANQKYRDPKIQEFKDKYLKEDVPRLLEAERAKGQKQPWELKIEELEKRQLDKDRELNLEKQKNKALAKAQSLGLIADEAFISKFIGETDEETEAGLEYLSKTLLPYRDNAVNTALKGVGTQPRPQGGKGPGPNDLQTQYAEAVKAGNGVEMLRLKGLIQASASGVGA